jgi:hypothetical protein
VAARLRTRPGPLSDLARHVVLPSGLVSTGWPAVREKCSEFGDSFDEWQEGAGRAMLGKRADGQYAATVGGVVLSIPRQVAKTFLVGRVVVALCILFPGLTVLWTAHHGRTLTRTFAAMQAFVKRRKVFPYVAHNGIRTTNGQEQITFRNGSMIMFGAREQGFGRGFEEVDVEVFDEAQILTERALEDMIAATNQSRHPHGALLFYMGTPPRPVDPGEAFTLKREKALSGKSDDMVYIEFSADRDADLDDPRQWAKANPSFPHRTPLQSMQRLRENLLTDDAWRREALGIWDEPVAKDAPWRLTLDEWALTEQVGLATCVPSVFFITMAKELRSTTIAAAGRGADWPHVKLEDHRPGTMWLVGRVRELARDHPGAVFAAYSVGPVKAWKPDFDREGIDLQLVTQPQAAAAYAHLKRVVESKEFTHSVDGVIDDSIQGLERRELDAGAWVIDWKSSTSDPAPIAAEIGALWLLESVPDRSSPGVYVF